MRNPYSEQSFLLSEATTVETGRYGKVGHLADYIRSSDI